jgi:hypothetical protein
VQVLSRCPLRVASILWLPAPSAYALTVVCKATFQLAPDLSPLAAEQDAPFEQDAYCDDDPTRSLDFASDLVPFKRQPEVLLVGHAHAPHGQAVASLLARLTIAEVDKVIEVTGDRCFQIDGALSAPARFTKMPLRWERAAGGPDTSNPVGVPMGGEAYPDAWGRVAVPNLVPLGSSVLEPHDVVEPVCFAPIAPAWPSRMVRLHRHASTWSHDAWHVRPMPADFDAGYFNAAPLDQALHELAGTERILLENLHPRHPQLRTRLARIEPRATVDWGSGPKQELPLLCDTLLVDTDRGVASLTFRGQVALDVPERSGWIVITMEDRAREVVPAWIERVGDVNETVAHEGASAAAPAPLPFLYQQVQSSYQQVQTSIELDDRDLESADSSSSDGDLDNAATFTSDHGNPAPWPASAGPPLAVLTPALAPIAPPPPAPMAPPAYATPSFEPASAAAPPAYATPSFEPAPVVAPPAYAAPAIEPAPPMATLGQSLAAPLGAAPQGMTIGERVAQARAALDSLPKPVAPAAAPSAEAEPPVPERAPTPPPPPLMLGPLATPEMVAADMGPALGEMDTADAPPDEPPEVEPPSEPSPPEPEPPPPEPLPLEEYPLERCARIAASVARTREKTAEILKAQDLDEAHWTPLKEHWLAEIRKQTDRGKTALLRAWDAAYVAQLEEERGPIVVEEYARIVIASERGTANATLAELSLPEGCALRVQRVWMTRMNQDPELGRLARAAIEIESEK